MSVEDSAVQPVEIDLDCTRELQITWADRQRCVYPLVLLRRECPWATCRQECAEQESNPLRVVQPVAEQHSLVIATRAELVGNYGLRITWKDGHDTGIYDYALLRSLCPAGERGR